MSNHLGPRADSRAYNALVSLISAGGQKHASDLRRATAATLTPSEFQNTVLCRLQRLGFATVTDGVVAVTEAGHRYIHPPAVEPTAVREAVASPYKAAPRDLVKRVRQLPIRAGAFDYRDVPSRHGDQRVPFKVGYPGLGATQE